MSLENRAELVFLQAWRRIPLPLRHGLEIAGVTVTDLGAKHGIWDDGTREIKLDYKLFPAPPGRWPVIDEYGNEHPHRNAARTTRALHTCIHELWHAIGTQYGYDAEVPWWELSGWLLTSEDIPGTSRYVELRPGWEYGKSFWCHAQWAWFPRPYSSKSPEEDFADCGTLVSLGWISRFSGPRAHRKLAYLYGCIQAQGKNILSDQFG